MRIAAIGCEPLQLARVHLESSQSLEVYRRNGGYEALKKVLSGMSPDDQLPEIVERPDHPWFIGVQFHPELKSRPFDPHPLFAGFIEAAVKQSRLV